MLQENVEESLALVKSLKLSLHIAQCKLHKDQERLAEVAPKGKCGVGKFEWEPSWEDDELASRRQVEFKGKGNWREDALAEEREAKVKANTKGKGKFS